MCKVTARRGKKATIQIEPIPFDVPKNKPQGPPLEETEKQVIAAVARAKTVEDIEAITIRDRYKRFMHAARKDRPEMAERVAACVTKRIEKLSSVDDDAWPDDAWREEMPA